MNATEAQLQGILNGPNRYIVPVFQRYYSWEKKNWEQLWEDIEALIESSKIKGNATHFMGSLVFIPEELLPNKPPTFQIIDGQQRMMTLIILLCAIRNVATDYGLPALALEINDTLIVHPYKKGLEHYRVYPRQQDKDDYESMITKENSPTGIVGETLSYFEKKIYEKSNLKEKEELQHFTQIIKNGLEFVLITLGKENPYQIFKSLNSTGIDLEEGDLIRNYVFMHLPIEKQDEFDKKLWKPLEEKFVDGEGNLDGKLISSFFRDYLMSSGDYVRQSETYQAFEEKYPSKTINPEDITKEINKSATLYNIIRGEDRHPVKDVEQALVKLRELDSSTTYPLILKLMLQNFQDSDLEEAINWLSGFILRRYICHESSRAYSRWYVSACRELNKKKNLGKLRMFLISKGFPSDSRFEENFIQFQLYGSRYAKPILARIERSFGHKEIVNLDNTQLEHIMPRTINKKWMNYLGAEAIETHETLLHTIGNLTLSGYNPELSNSPFDKKKEEYRKSNIVITKNLSKFEKWNKETITERSRIFARIASGIWKAPDNTLPSGDYSEKGNYGNGEVNKLRKMLTRIPVPKGQLDLYRVLIDAGENGISWSELVKKMGRKRIQMAGVIGALGARINNTDGLDDEQGTAHVLDIWEVKGEWFYRLKPEIIKAIEIEGILNQ